MRGLGGIFTRDLKITQEDTVTGDTITDVIVSGPGGQYPSWGHGQAPYRGGMGIPAAWRCALLLSDLLGRLPWDLYRRSPGAEPDDPPTVLPTPTLIEQPAPPDPRIVTFSSWGLDLLWHGNAVGLIADRDRAGYPTAITPFPAERTWIKRVQRGDGLPLPVGSIAYAFGDTAPELGTGSSSPEYGAPPSPWQSRRWYRPDEVFHVKGPCVPGALRGMGVLECHLTGGLALAGTLADQAGNVADAGVPTVLIRSLNPDMRQGKAQELKQQAIETQRRRSPMVVNALTEVTPLSWNPSDSQLVEARQLSDVQCATMFGCDASWVNAPQASRPYQNIEQTGIDFLRHSAGGWLARFEAALTGCFPRGQWVEANRDAELQADTLTRFQVYEIAIRNKILTRDEVRALERRRALTAAQRADMDDAAGGGTPPDGGQQLDDEGDNPQGSAQPGRLGPQGSRPRRLAVAGRGEGDE